MLLLYIFIEIRW